MRPLSSAYSSLARAWLLPPGRALRGGRPCLWLTCRYWSAPLSWGSLLDPDRESDSARGGWNWGFPLGRLGRWGYGEFRGRGFFCTYLGAPRGLPKPSSKDGACPQPQLPDLLPTWKWGAPGRPPRERGCRGLRPGPPLRGSSSLSLSPGEPASRGAPGAQCMLLGQASTPTTAPQASTLRCPSGRNTGWVFLWASRSWTRWYLGAPGHMRSQPRWKRGSEWTSSMCLVAVTGARAQFLGRSQGPARGPRGRL